MAILPQDLTVILYTAHKIPNTFEAYTRHHLLDSLPDGVELIIDEIDEGVNPSHVNIYYQALRGAKKATTKYIALCEDDVLYAPEHFNHRPSPGKFAYNVNAWNIYTWEDTPMFTQKMGGRRNLNSLICERELFISAMTERFMNYPDWDKIDLSVWAEPGKYEKYLGVTVRETEVFTSNPPNIVFSHENELSFQGLGKRKRVGEIRALEIPHWGTAEQIRRLYV